MVRIQNLRLILVAVLRHRSCECCGIRHAYGAAWCNKRGPNFIRDAITRQRVMQYNAHHGVDNPLLQELIDSQSTQQGVSPNRLRFLRPFSSTLVLLRNMLSFRILKKILPLTKLRILRLFQSVLLPL